jgi:hypothetical protein
MTISREIGWSPEANLMYSISNKIDRITQIMCCAGVTTTTTTTCVTEGEYITVMSIADNYIPIIGEPVSFIDSQEATCAAILVVEGLGGVFNYFDVDVYILGDNNYYYITGTCILLPTGYYVIHLEGARGYHITNGEIDEYDICPITTTTTTLI